jgi:hypothetical protein
MPKTELAEIVAALTPAEQDAVRAFIEYLRREPLPPKSPLLSAAEEFMSEHPELLRRLAQ